MGVEQETIDSLRKRIEYSKEQIDSKREDIERLKQDILDCHRVIAKIKGEMNERRTEEENGTDK